MFHCGRVSGSCVCLHVRVCLRVYVCVHVCNQCIVICQQVGPAKWDGGTCSWNVWGNCCCGETQMIINMYHIAQKFDGRKV